MNLHLLLPPVAGAIIGWFTNYVTIKLLFRPHIPVDLFGYSLQGIIPKRRKDIAHSIAHTIENELLSSEEIATSLNGLDWTGEVEKTVEEVVEHRFSSKLSGLPVIGLVADNIKYHVKYLVTKEILTQIDKKKDLLASKLKEKVDIKKHVVAKIDNLDLERFEGLLTAFISNELRHLAWLGAAIGFAIGVGQSFLQYYYWR
ncbi:MAG: DUF445 family protein [Deltaproteobacteria bacterium]|nr:DUF445 family protein [Deltaproteobacteria bacterium]